MNSADRLQMLKIELNASGSTIRDVQFNALLESATSMIGREGITLNLDDSYEDNTLVIGYAAYLFYQRADASAQMPRWLRYALNNRLLSEKGKGR